MTATLKTPLLVYLDSSDFSTLSEPHLSQEPLALIQMLVEWTRAGQIKLVFSGTHLMEMAPLDSVYTQAAAARADLMVSLCGRNAVMSLDRLIEWELKVLTGASPSVPQIVSSNGEWYPEWGQMISPVQWIEAARDVDGIAKEQGLNRQQRRLVKRSLFRGGGRPKRKTNQFLAANEPTSDYSEILERYPMRPEDARVFGQYVAGKATAQQANEAFLESLRDPKWMMRWFAEHHSKLTPLIQWLRGPSEKMLIAANAMAAAMQTLRLNRARHTSGERPAGFTAETWSQMQDQFLCTVATRLLEHHSLPRTSTLSAKDVDQACPGFTTFVRSVHSALKDVTTETPRQAKASDFVDGAHALYAPYVDVFRADSYMANHIRKSLPNGGTTVVPKLSMLRAAIDSRLAG